MDEVIADDVEGEGEGGSRYEVLLLGDNKETLYFCVFLCLCVCVFGFTGHSAGK